ncbi:hypothetical protein K438DRAFT_1766008 [Mycena galopus ATCC 62051]|nr:hypothetical protein K438DRAFT_1766008 [Mycena galopus ATCC 62051]
METSRPCDWWATKKWMNNGEKAGRRVLFPAHMVERIALTASTRPKPRKSNGTHNVCVSAGYSQQDQEQPSAKADSAADARQALLHTCGYKPTVKVPAQEEQSAGTSKNRHIPSDNETEPQQEEDVEPVDDEEMIEPPPLDEDDANFNLANQNETAPNEEDLVDYPSGKIGFFYLMGRLDEPNAEASNTTKHFLTHIPTFIFQPIDRHPRPRRQDKKAANPQKDLFDLSSRWEKHRDEQHVRLSKQQPYLANPPQRLQDDDEDEDHNDSDFQDKSGMGYNNIDPYPSPHPRLRSASSEHSSPPLAHSVSPGSAARGRGCSPRRPQRPSLSPPPAATPSRPRSLSTPRLIAADSLRPVPHESDDDYHVHQEAKRKSKQYKADRGRSHSPNTKDEDEEGNLDFDVEIEEQALEDEELTPKSKMSAPKKTKAPNMKATSSKAAASKDRGRRGRARGKPRNWRLSREDEDKDKDKDDDADEGNDISPEGGYKKGPIPEKTKKKVHALYAQLIDDVKALAAECRKPITSLNRFNWQGTLRYQRLESLAEIFQRTSNQRTEERYPDFSKHSRAGFIKVLGPDFPENQHHNTEAVFKVLPVLCDWNADVDVTGVIESHGKKKLKPPLPKEVKPITHIGEASFAFGMGNAYKEMCNTFHHQLAMQVKDQEHVFYGIELRKRGEEARTLPLKRLNTGDQEPGRDASRKIFS